MWKRFTARISVTLSNCSRHTKISYFFVLHIFITVRSNRSALVMDLVLSMLLTYFKLFQLSQTSVRDNMKSLFSSDERKGIKNRYNLQNETYSMEYNYVWNNNKKKVIKPWKSNYYRNVSVFYKFSVYSSIICYHIYTIVELEMIILNMLSYKK